MEERDTNGDESSAQAPADVESTSAPTLGPSTAIGRRLKAYYDDVASEPVPDRFLSLLDALDASERNRQPGKK